MREPVSGARFCSKKVEQIRRNNQHRVYWYRNGWFQRTDNMKWAVSYSRIYVDVDYDSTCISFRIYVKEGDPEWFTMSSWEIT